MLVFKAAQVIACNVQDPKEWTMNGRSGVTHSAKLAVIGPMADVASITLKAKTAEELKAKAAKYPIGKPAEVHVVDIVPVFKSGDRKASAYEYTA